MNFIRYTRDLGEDSSGRRLDEYVYVPVSEIDHVTIHKQYQRADIFTKTGEKHSLYELWEIEGLQARLDKLGGYVA